MQLLVDNFVFREIKEIGRTSYTSYAYIPGQASSFDISGHANQIYTLTFLC